MMRWLADPEAIRKWFEREAKENWPVVGGLPRGLNADEQSGDVDAEDGE